MSKTAKKVTQRQRIRRRIRAKIAGTPQRPRLAVFRSNKHIYAQLIDDLAGATLAAASTREGETMIGVDASKAVGQRIAERAKEAGIDRAVFDRGGYRYHGNVKAVAEGARAAGLTL
ncbi:50S ribosomal protein L18 [Rubrivirga sp. IMCC43871]|uniref:50S ribosomal protein L18 n=1 Tax=Rubrivirga sp. IMCC43871 TaxID=3391575 RepID=UPI00398F9434